MIKQVDLSERRACQLVGLSRDSYRHPPVQDHQSAALSAAIIDIAQVRRRFGYRRIHDLLRLEFPDVNHKRVYRLGTSRAGRTNPTANISSRATALPT